MDEIRNLQFERELPPFNDTDAVSRMWQEYYSSMPKEDVLHELFNHLENVDKLGSILQLVLDAKKPVNSREVQIMAILKFVPRLRQLGCELPRQKYKFSEIVEILAECSEIYTPKNEKLFEQICDNPLKINKNDLDARHEVISFLCAIADKLVLMQKNYSYPESEMEASYTEYSDYINQLVMRYSKLKFVRIDYIYQKHLSKEVELEQLELDLTRFRNNRRKNSTFDTLRGYITRVGYSIEKGLYVKMLFFFDGNLKSHISDEVLADKLVNYWTKITKRQGQCFIHNVHDQFKTHNLGLIDKGDVKKIQYLKSELRELCRKDKQTIKPHGMPHKRLLNKGHLSNHE